MFGLEGYRYVHTCEQLWHQIQKTANIRYRLNKVKNIFSNKVQVIYNVSLQECLPCPSLTRENSIMPFKNHLPIKSLLASQTRHFLPIWAQKLTNQRRVTKTGVAAG